MLQRKVGRILAIGAATAIFFSTMAAWAVAGNVEAPAAQISRLVAQEVKGQLLTSSSAHYLQLEPAAPDVVMKLTLTFDQPVGFWVLDPAGLRQVLSRTRPFEVNIAAGNKLANAPDNQLGADVKASGPGPYTVIVYNNSQGAAAYTLKADNATIVDESGQVVDAAALAVTPTAEMPVAVVAAVVVNPTPTAATVVAPAAAVASAQPGTVRGVELKGQLPDRSTLHYLGLQPVAPDVVVKLALTYDQPAGFWVLDGDGLRKMFGVSRPYEVNIAASNKVPNTPDNQLGAEVKSVGLGPYTVIVYNDSQSPANYILSAANGILVDDSGQTVGAAMPASAGAATPTVVTEAAAPATAAVAVTPTPQAVAASAPAAGQGAALGGMYSVQAGDTLIQIAARMYGDATLWQKLCAFNQLQDCNRLAVGQQLSLPTLEQLSTVQ